MQMFPRFPPKRVGLEVYPESVPVRLHEDSEFNWVMCGVHCLKLDLLDSKDSQDYGVFLSENCAL